MCLARAKLPSSTCIIHSLRHDQGHLPGTQFLGLSKFNFWALRVLNCLRLLLVKFDFGERLWKRQGQKCLKETCLCNSCCSKWYKMVSCRGIPWLQEVLQEAGSNAKSIRNCTARLKAPYAKDNKQIIGQRIVKENILHKVEQKPWVRPGAMFVLDSSPFAKNVKANPFPFVSHKHANFYPNLSCMATLSKLHAGIGPCQFVVQVMLSEFRSRYNDQAWEGWQNQWHQTHGCATPWQCDVHRLNWQLDGV